MPPSLPTLVDARAIALLHDEQTARWHQGAEDAVLEAEASGGGGMPSVALAPLLTKLHRANFLLWHAEDEARRPQAEDGTVVTAKRTIDRVNQQRNDAVERIDDLLLARLAAVERSADAEQHSETPGMIIDRLSILSLKAFHTREEMERALAPAGHQERNRRRLAILLEQRYDLTSCLDRLWSQVCAGSRYFKRYQQLKMYNDPELNPVLYGAKPL
jgi:Protein of unknown function (DUF4254)